MSSTQPYAQIDVLNLLPATVPRTLPGLAGASDPLYLSK
jgi:hypothetical protein